MWKILVVAVLAVVGLGCTARMRVVKVTPDPADDHVKGFRYFLSRPYVIVQKPILVSEDIKVGKYTPKTLEQAPLQAREVRDIPGALARQIKPAELDAIRSRVDANQGLVRQAAAQGDEVNPGVNTFDTVASGVGTPLEIPNDTPLKLTDEARVKGDIRIVFLPDFEETYAVDNRNFLSKSAYKLAFRDGWQLSDVSGEFDSQTVAIELLTAIDNAVNSARDIEKAEIDRRKAVAEAAAKEMEKREANATKDRFTATYYQEITRTYIKPGVYRINKPWETEGGMNAQGCGLLTNLGLTLSQVTERQVLYANRADISGLGKAKSGEVGK